MWVHATIGRGVHGGSIRWVRLCFGFFDQAFGFADFGLHAVEFRANRGNVVRHGAGDDHGSGAIPIVSVLAQFVNAARVLDLLLLELHLQLRLRADLLAAVHHFVGEVGESAFDVVRYHG